MNLSSARLIGRLILKNSYRQLVPSTVIGITATQYNPFTSLNKHESASMNDITTGQQTFSLFAKPIALKNSPGANYPHPMLFQHTQANELLVGPLRRTTEDIILDAKSANEVLSSISRVSLPTSFVTKTTVGVNPSQLPLESQQAVANNVPVSIRSVKYASPQVQPPVVPSAKSLLSPAQVAINPVPSVPILSIDNNSANGNQEVDAITQLHAVFSQCRTPYDIERAIDVVMSMASHNIPISEETVSLFVKACCKSGAPERVIEVFEKPGLYRMRPTRKAAHYAMVKLSLDRNLTGVEKMWNTLERYYITPTAQTYHVIVRACCDNDNLDRALHHYERSIDQNIKLERGTYNILMKACYEDAVQPVERLKLMFELYKEMVERGIEPNEGTLMLLAQGYVRVGDIDDSLEALRTLVDIGDRDKLQDNDMAVRNFGSVIDSIRNLALKKGTPQHMSLLEKCEKAIFAHIPAPGSMA